MSTIKVMIVDDEAPARLNVSRAIDEVDGWSVVCELANANTLNDDVRRYKPDLIFLDIDMPGVDGVEAVKRLQAKDSSPIVIFVTAYDEYAVQAFDLYALDYILKPFDGVRFSKCVSRVTDMVSNRKTYHLNLQRYYDQEPLEQLVIKSTSSIRVVPVDDVVYLKSSGNYVEVHHLGGCHLMRISLSQLEKHLDVATFMRVHRQAVVRLDSAVELKSVSSDTNILVLKNGDQVQVSERYKSDFLAVWIGD